MKSLLLLRRILISYSVRTRMGKRDSYRLFISYDYTLTYSAHNKEMDCIILCITPFSICVLPT